LQPASRPAHRDSLMAASPHRMSLKLASHIPLHNKPKDICLTAEAKKSAVMLRPGWKPCGNFSLTQHMKVCADSPLAR
jgi:hypothetical protein